MVGSGTLSSPAPFVLSPDADGDNASDLRSSANTVALSCASSLRLARIFSNDRGSNAARTLQAGTAAAGAAQEQVRLSSNYFNSASIK